LHCIVCIVVVVVAGIAAAHYFSDFTLLRRGKNDKRRVWEHVPGKQWVYMGWVS
jgi:hypothetical protein